MTILKHKEAKSEHGFALLKGSLTIYYWTGIDFLKWKKERKSQHNTIKLLYFKPQIY